MAGVLVSFLRQISVAPVVDTLDRRCKQLLKASDC